MMRIALHVISRDPVPLRGFASGTIRGMSEVASPETKTPKVGFVSLGCPKALTDSELILTQLSAEGYQTSKTFEGADLVIVNTCGFIDDAVRESLDTIGEALAENGKVIVTGCLGAKAGAGGGNLVRQMHPSVLAVTGPHATQEVMDAVHANLPKPHDPFMDLVPAAGIKLTPRHYAYLKISEGCNHRCTFCIIPSMRGDLVSRPIGDVLKEARALFEGGVKELLVVSQDTSAYGVDVKYRTGFFDGKPIKTRMLELVQALGEMAEPFGAWVRLHYVYPYPSVDEVIPLMAYRQGPALPGRAVPAQPSRRAAPDEAAGQRREEPGAHPALARGLSRDRDPQHLHRGLPRGNRGRVRSPAAVHARGAHRPGRLFCLQPGGRRRRQRHSRHAAASTCARNAARASWRWPRKCRQPSCANASAPTMQVLVDSAPGARPQGRRGAQLRRCAGDRRNREAAAAGKAEQAADRG